MWLSHHSQAEPGIVQRVLGHRDIRSTLAYAELTEAQVRAALEDVSKH